VLTEKEGAMHTEDQELGPYKPAADALILAAIERAIRHGTETVWITTVGEHLGFEHTAHNTLCRNLGDDCGRFAVCRCDGVAGKV
jgi:hypothetical protein